METVETRVRNPPAGKIGDTGAPFLTPEGGGPPVLTTGGGDPPSSAPTTPGKPTGAGAETSPARTPEIAGTEAAMGFVCDVNACV